MSLYDIKNSVIKELDWKLKNEILEKTNYDLLVKLIDRAEDEKEVSAIFQLGTQYYKTGLKYDVRLEKTSPDIHYLKKNKEKSFETDPNALTHKLIIGDNYYALLNLLISHRGLIDVIYIDPPYGCDSMGQFADTNYDNHITRDNLLSMLHTRLILAKQLLSETGVIFCSIDDRNQAYIKCLFDNVFGEENFIGNILRKTVTQRAMAKNFNIQHEYCLFYAKNINEIDIKGKEKDFNCYSNPDNDPNGDWKISDPTMKNSNNIFEIKNPFTNKTDMPPIGRGWCFTKEKMQELINNKVFIFKNEYKENERGFFIKKYKKDLKSNYLLVNSLELCDNKYLNENATKEIISIFDNTVFDYPKPVSFIKDLINYTSNQDAIVLDFFAGSGTTGQAVLDLNREDGGNRKFILCTNNDKDDVNINGIAYDVTCERLKRVMTGKDYNEESNFKWAEKNEPYGDNLLVCECETINNFTQIPGNNAFENIDETLYDQKKMNDTEKIKWVCENFNLTCKYIEGEE